MVLGKHLEYGEPSKLELWLASADSIQDPCVFLVRSSLGSPAFARVCTEADMVNYPTAADSAPGWYRVAGLEFELYSSETMGRLLADIDSGLASLDTGLEASASAEATEDIELALHMYRIGDSIGKLDVSKVDLGDSFSYTFSVEFSDTDVQTAVSTSVFKVSQGDFVELLGIRTPADVEDSVSVAFTDAVTVHLNKVDPTIEARLYGALVADIEDLCSFSVGAL